MSSEEKWNTSEGLRAEFPGIEAAKGWKTFAVIYDEPQFQNKRLRHWRESSQGFCISPMLLQFRELAETVRDKDSHRASTQLANFVLKLLSKENRALFKDFAEEVIEHNAQHDGKDRNSSDLVWALIKFIERENRLPKKKELNIEAERIASLVRMEWRTEDAPPTFGEIVEGKALIPRYSPTKYRVYGSKDDGEERCIWVCPKHKWDAPRWEPPDFSRHLAACGLAGLGGHK